MKGVYVLMIDVAERLELSVGRLGKLTFLPGLYAYVGSGMNNLEKRLMRHLKKDKRQFWHIDYLLKKAKIVGMLTIETDCSIECEIARHLSHKYRVIRGFGSSDCRCEGHLFYLFSH